MKICKKCKRTLADNEFRDGVVCKYCREKNIVKMLKKKNGRKILKDSVEYNWVFRLLNKGEHNCVVSKMLYDELVMIDNRFKNVKKRDLPKEYADESDCYILYKTKEVWL